ncbi:hypothetical protein CVN76_12190 [Bacillus sp. mrc49]|nr:hypothetical protein CVN76_12190 [Bacillus sp. mrc49]
MIEKKIIKPKNGCCRQPFFSFIEEFPVSFSSVYVISNTGKYPAKKKCLKPKTMNGQSDFAEKPKKIFPLIEGKSAYIKNERMKPFAWKCT